MSETKTYLNWKGPKGLETLDVVIKSELKLNARDFRREVARLCAEYAMAGMHVYPSSRCCAGWNQ